jgi:hypothetical protein
MNSKQWDVALHPAVSWKTAYNAVEIAVTSLYLTDPKDRSTTELVETLYPVADARGPEGVKARKRMFKALTALAERGLAPYATRLPARKAVYSDRLIRPWLWHAPRDTASPQKLCPHCGGTLS